MKRLIRAAVLAAALSLTSTVATPRPAQAEEGILCQLICLNAAVACAALSESVNCFFFWEGCLDGCKIA